MSLKQYIVISIAIVVLIAFGSYFIYKDQFEFSKLVGIVEEPLEKNKGIMILPDESYIYKIEQFGESVEFEYKVFLGQTCMQIAIELEEGYTFSCLNNEGNDEGGSNISMVNNAIIMFKPWMLALDKNWTWNAKYVSLHDNKILEEYDFKTVGMEKIFGRNSYKIEISSGELLVVVWVDEYKRILLKEIGNGYSAEIISAPFPLNKS